MKKVFSLLMAVTIIAAALVFNTRSVSAAPLGVTVYVKAFESKNAGTKVPAQFWADSDWHSVYCVMTDVSGYISCKFSEKYSGKSITLKLNDSLIFYVTVPVQRENAWTWVANENETFNVPAGTYEVRYGANGSYYTQTFTGPTTVVCNNATFGDPILYVVKACYILK